MCASGKVRSGLRESFPFAHRLPGRKSGLDSALGDVKRLSGSSAKNISTFLKDVGGQSRIGGRKPHSGNELRGKTNADEAQCEHAN